MLSFLQKYQRSFFIFITTLTIVSFLFFGLGDVINRTSVEREDKEIGKKLDGSSLMRSEVEDLAKFISSEMHDVIINHRGQVNLCNDGIVGHDLIQTKIAEIFVSDFLDVLKDDLGLKLEKAKRFKGYERLDAPFISVKNVYAGFKPEISKTLELLKGSDQVDLQTYQYLAELYQLQRTCPPELLKFGLSMMQKQYSWLKADPKLAFADLSLFGFHTLGDFFGQNFLQIAAEFILHTAAKAKENGYEVTLEEAENALRANFEKALEKYPFIAAKEKSWKECVKSLGFEESQAVALWKEVLLFRRYFETIGDATFIDKLPFQEFASFARKSFEVQSYHFPEALHFQNLDDVISFQVYLHALGLDLQSLQMPQESINVAKVLEKFPLLVHETYKAQISEISYEDVGLSASFNQILSWQMNPENWALLAKEFPILSESKAPSCDVIVALSLDDRAKVDSFSRIQWAKQSTDLVSSILNTKPFVEKEFTVSKNYVSLDGIEDVKSFIAFLEVFDEAKEGQIFADTSGRFYRLEKLEKVEPLHVLTFEKACQKSIMTKIADEFMEKKYEKIRSKYPQKFQVGDGQWKLYSTCKDDVAKIVFKDLFEKIGGKNFSEKQLATHRLEKIATLAYSSLKDHENIEKWVLVSPQDPILDQFKLIQTSRQIQKITNDDWMKDQIFTMTPKSWSPIYVPEDGNVAFFYFEEEKVFDEPIFSQINFGKATIASDAKCFAAKNLALKIKQNQGFVLPVNNKEFP